MSKALILFAIVIIFASLTQAQEDYDQLFQVNEIYDEIEYTLSGYKQFTICLSSNNKLCLYATSTNTTLFWANNNNSTNPLYGFRYTAMVWGVKHAIRKPGCSTYSNTNDWRVCGIDYINGKYFDTTSNILLYFNIHPGYISNYADWKII